MGSDFGEIWFIFLTAKGAITMAIGERIHFFRTKRGMTQKYVGGQIGFDEKSALPLRAVRSSSEPEPQVGS